MTLAERGEALISIAHPAFQGELRRALARAGYVARRPSGSRCRASAPDGVSASLPPCIERRRPPRQGTGAAEHISDADDQPTRRVSS